MSIEQAKAGDELAFTALVEPHGASCRCTATACSARCRTPRTWSRRRCSPPGAALGGFEGRASLRAWLYRIATNRCLNALRDRTRRPAVEEMPMAPPPTRYLEPTWLEPYPDSALAGSGHPARRRVTSNARRRSSRSSPGCSSCPPRQRAALVLRDVLGFGTEEAARMLDVTPQSVKGALQRARATLDQRAPERERAPLPDSPAERELVAHFSDAFEAGDTARRRRAADRRRAHDDAAAAARVRRSRGDRRVPRLARRDSWRAAPAAPDARERRPAGVRLLSALARVGLAHADAER